MYADGGSEKMKMVYSFFLLSSVFKDCQEDVYGFKNCVRVCVYDSGSYTINRSFEYYLVKAVKKS